jgi:hypothetical protein
LRAPFFLPDEKWTLNLPAADQPLPVHQRGQTHLTQPRKTNAAKMAFLMSAKN